MKKASITRRQGLTPKERKGGFPTPFRGIAWDRSKPIPIPVSAPEKGPVVFDFSKEQEP